MKLIASPAVWYALVSILRSNVLGRVEATLILGLQSANRPSDGCARSENALG
jgi:hypothetical protein